MVASSGAGKASLAGVSVAATAASTNGALPCTGKKLDSACQAPPAEVAALAMATSTARRVTLAWLTAKCRRMAARSGSVVAGECATAIVRGGCASARASAVTSRLTGTLRR